MATKRLGRWQVLVGAGVGLLLVQHGCDGPSEAASTPPSASGQDRNNTEGTQAAPAPASGCAPAACAEQGIAAFKSGDFKTAHDPLAYACTNGQANACRYHGMIFERGNGVEQDFTRASKLYEQSCQGGDGAGCQLRGHLARNGRGQDRDLKQAFGFYERACDAGDGVGCAAAGDMMYGGQGVAESMGGAIKFFERACERDQLVACLNAGELLFDPTGAPEQNQRAVAVLTRGCEQGNADACVKLGICYYNGVGVAADAAAAHKHFTSGCSGGADDGCHAAEQLDKAKGKQVTLELTTAVESSNIDGVTARNLSCRMREQGYMAIGEIMSSLGKQLKALEKCGAAGEAPTITWAFRPKRVTSVKVEHTSTPKVEKCIARALKKTRPAQQGQCTVTLLLGDRDRAAAALKARK